MRMPTLGSSLHSIQLEQIISEEAAAKIESGHLWLDDTYCNPLLEVSKSSIVLQPDGEPLFILVKGIIDTAVTSAAKPYLRKIATNRVIGGIRGASSGGVAPVYREDGSLRSGLRVPHHEYLVGAKEGMIGFYDRTGRENYCRMTAYTRKNVEDYFRLLPYFQAVDRVYRDYAPEKYEAQRQHVLATQPDWIIPDTNASTVTQNLNYRTSAHRDEGDCRAGLGVITVNPSGICSGGALCFPEFGCSVRLAEGDVLLANVHAIHGNLPVSLDPSRAERLASIFYVREKMTECGSLAEETHRYEERYKR